MTAIVEFVNLTKTHPVEGSNQRFNWWVTWIAVLTIIVLVQAAQFFGNWLSGKALRR